MTAQQTARYIERHVVKQGLGIRVKCRPGGDRWDYDCTLSGGPERGPALERTFGYDVNEHEVTGFSG